MVRLLRDSEEFHVVFELFDDFFDLIFSVLETLCVVGFYKLLIPFNVLFFGEVLLRNNERSESFSREILAFIEQETSLNFWHSALHNRISSLQVEDDSIGR